MTTSFPSSETAPATHPREVYKRGLDDVSDVYVVRSGPAAENGWRSGVPLFLVETSTGEQPDMAMVQEYTIKTHYDRHDIQAPELLDYQDLADKLDRIERLAGVQAVGGQ